MIEILLAIAVALGAASLVLLCLLLGRTQAGAIERLGATLEGMRERSERITHSVSEELRSGRTEAANSAQLQRQELQDVLRELRDSVHQTLAGAIEIQKQARTEASEHARLGRDETAGAFKSLTDSLVQQLTATTALLQQSLVQLAESSEKRSEALQVAVEHKLHALQEDSASHLERMRQTVDEKLQGTLEQRLGQSFQQVSARLEEVHRGLGEMQALASGVGDLKKVMTNVRARGIWGEIQLARLLEDLFTPEQYSANVAVRPGSQERVEFALRLPGRDPIAKDVVWLPIDAKFPREGYQRIFEAAETGDTPAIEAACKELETRIRLCAREIATKYVCPPHTTDFAILFLPTEGLYAEVIRRSNLIEDLQREHRVVVAGPTTLAALLNSLQMGFRTLAIQRRSSEVWQVLGAIKTEFGRFGEVMGKVQQKLQEASNAVEQAKVRTRVMERQLRDVEEIPSPAAQLTLIPEP